MKVSTFLNPWLLVFYGLIGSAFASLSVITSEGLDSYLLLVAAAWAMIVVPVNILLLYPILWLFYTFVKTAGARVSACGACSVVSFMAGLVSLQVIMSV